MVVVQREFYRSARGPSPADEDWWVLVFDGRIGRLFVRHEWQATGHGGIDEFEIAEFLEQKSAAQSALIDSLFQVHAHAHAHASGQERPARPGRTVHLV